MDGNPQPFLTSNEVAALSIRRGSLSDKERREIESHVTHTFRFLSEIPWTGEYRGVPDIAYAHHEKLDGTGYPRKLKAEDIPIQSRMMTISDIFDALVAWDRPYKKSVPVERALDILADETRHGKLDASLLAVFVEAKVYERTLPRAGAEAEVSSITPLVIAHRGDSAHRPENTLASFQSALEVGAALVEFDVQLTRDEHVVVIHDPTVDRTTSGRGRVDEMTPRRAARLVRRLPRALRHALRRGADPHPRRGARLPPGPRARHDRDQGRFRDRRRPGGHRSPHHRGGAAAGHVGRPGPHLLRHPGPPAMPRPGAGDRARPPLRSRAARKRSPPRWRSGPRS